MMRLLIAISVLAISASAGLLDQMWSSASRVGSRLTFETHPSKNRATPVTLGVQVGSDPLVRTIITTGTAQPATGVYLHKQESAQATETLEVLVVAINGTGSVVSHVVGETTAVDVPVQEGLIEIEVILDVDASGSLFVSIRRGPTLFFKRRLPAYAAVFVPLEAELGNCRDSVAMSKQQASDLNKKLKSLEKDLEERGRELWALLRDGSDQDVRRKQMAVSSRQLVQELEAERNETTELSLRLRSLEQENERLAQHVREAGGAKLLEEFRRAAREELSSSSCLGAVEGSPDDGGSHVWVVLLVTITALLVILPAIAMWRWQQASAEEDGSGGVAGEAKKERRRLLRLLARVRQGSKDESSSGAFGADMFEKDGFRFTVQQESLHGRPSRRVRIQCPGVEPSNVDIQVIFNGALVRIRRRDSAGKTVLNWSKQFQFTAAEGHFEFRDEYAKLEHGVLELVFQACIVVKRRFRFPQQVQEFDMSFSDAEIPEGAWLSPAAVANSHPLES
eukprot:TRINITY_DN77081_c0_g1_i1.p1 TRINITY_DN77081_c0_g1~~TRINITY_DN77081_c0_g1_i1.p1  ORF type:complete len:508 (+),score=85.52 TRINITY_DN77081_c0_g1_i1:113-1636(+)